MGATSGGGRRRGAQEEGVLLSRAYRAGLVPWWLLGGGGAAEDPALGSRGAGWRRPAARRGRGWGDGHTCVASHIAFNWALIPIKLVFHTYVRYKLYIIFIFSKFNDVYTLSGIHASVSVLTFC